MWINLSSKNLVQAKEFFEKIGFEINTRHQAPHMVSMFVGKNKVVVNLFEEKLFQGFMGGQNISDTKLSNEILFSIGADSTAQVDAIAAKVEAAGGALYGRPAYKDGWMYGFGFIDLDGHRWNILYMDMTKIPKT